ncbi:hypothetical protein MLD38_034098 [Melastoma candidum]|uniref:Uncharacterized protein n=1 Tax=Melastoma candidum TaxID=119954 RepID=A0ACB9MA89_9MYRT|nr:hypothetical protein MLD38_034098 [Melastoma candidum]
MAPTWRGSRTHPRRRGEAQQLRERGSAGAHHTHGKEERGPSAESGATAGGEVHLKGWRQRQGEDEGEGVYKEFAAGRIINGQVPASNGRASATTRHSGEQGQGCAAVPTTKFPLQTFQVKKPLDGRGVSSRTIHRVGMPSSHLSSRVEQNNKHYEEMSKLLSLV